MTLNADHLFVNGDRKPEGTYYAGDLDEFLEGDGAIHVCDTPIAVVGGTYHWTGAAGTLALGNANNWREQTAPNLSDGSASLSFSEGTGQAQVSGAISVMGLAFVTNAPFSLGTDGTGLMSIGAGGIAATNTASETVAFSVGSDMRITSVPQQWGVGSKARLQLAGNLSSTYDSPSGIAIYGEGGTNSQVVLSGDNSGLKCKLTATNVQVVARGPTALGATNHTFTIYSLGYAADARTLVLAGDESSSVITNRTPLAIVGNCWSLAENNGTPVRLEGLVTFGGGRKKTASAEASPTGFRVEADIHFAKGIAAFASHDMYFKANQFAKPTPTVYFDGPVSFGGSVLRMLGMTYVFGAPGSVGTFRLGSGASMVATCTNALPASGIIIGIETSRTNVVDLGGCDQTTAGIDCYNPAIKDYCVNVTSACPAVLHLTAPGNIPQYAFMGEAGLDVCVAAGETVTLTNVASTSCGPISVASGCLRFAEGASWTETPSVALGAAGTLSVGVTDPFGPLTGTSKTQASLSLVTGGSLEIAADCQVAVKDLWINGRRKVSGVYSASKVPWITGEGTLFVREGGGFSITVR